MARFRNIFTGQSVAVVGSDAALSEQGHGDRIDGHDVVIRTNRIHSGKTTVLTLGRSDLLNHVKDLPQFLWWMKLTPLGRHERRVVGDMKRLYGKTKICDWNRKLEDEVSRFVGSSPSTGMRMAYAMVEMCEPSSVDLFGMSCWGRIGKGNHLSWWQHGTDPHTSDRSHNPDSEAAALKRLGYVLKEDGWQSLTC